MKIKEAKEKFNCRKAYEIMIYDSPHQVWDIDGLEHEYGKWNGEPTTHWIETEEGVLEPFIQKGVHRICWEVNYKQKNTTKNKWDSLDIRSSGMCKIFANGKEVYSFASRSLEYAMSKAQSLIVDISEHPYNFIDQSKEEGRRI